MTALPGPSSGALLGNLMRFHTDPMGFLEDNARAHGDLVGFRFLGMPAVQVNHPDALREVLVNAEGAFVKGLGVEGFRPLVGQGLLLNEGEDHRRQRRLMQPAFHRQRIQGYGAVMLEEALAVRARWQEGQRVDMAEEMMGLTLRVAARALFGAQVSEADIVEVAQAMQAFTTWYHQSTHPAAPLLQALPSRVNREMRAGRAALVALVDRFIAARQGEGEAEDILSMLLAARDEQDGRSMDLAHVRDEAVTLLVAGHETTAATLTWAFWLLDQHPEVAARLRQEIEAATGGRPPELEDLPQLGYARRVFAETLRLYPSAVALPRQAAKATTLRGHEIREGTMLLLGAWVVHRDPRFWEQPERFDPDRFLPERSEGRPKHAYLPFSSGARTCIGEAFAWMEGTLVLSALAQAWAPRLEEGHVVQAEALFTLRPKGGMPMVIGR
ncbi:MAG: cytochrome P450 [Alphaproteobacteria bacterium]|nr:cytochrome P450 [Alphaproteobacteria bacterium]